MSVPYQRTYRNWTHERYELDEAVRMTNLPLSPYYPRHRILIAYSLGGMCLFATYEIIRELFLEEGPDPFISFLKDSPLLKTRRFLSSIFFGSYQWLTTVPATKLKEYSIAEYIRLSIWSPYGLYDYTQEPDDDDEELFDSNSEEEFRESDDQLDGSDDEKKEIQVKKEGEEGQEDQIQGQDDDENKEISAKNEGEESQEDQVQGQEFDENNEIPVKREGKKAQKGHTDVQSIVGNFKKEKKKKTKQELEAEEWARGPNAEYLNNESARQVKKDLREMRQRHYITYKEYVKGMKILSKRKYRSIDEFVDDIQEDANESRELHKDLALFPEKKPLQENPNEEKITEVYKQIRKYRERRNIFSEEEAYSSSSSSSNSSTDDYGIVDEKLESLLNENNVDSKENEIDNDLEEGKEEKEEEKKFEDPEDIRLRRMAILFRKSLRGGAYRNLNEEAYMWTTDPMADAYGWKNDSNIKKKRRKKSSKFEAIRQSFPSSSSPDDK